LIGACSLQLQLKHAAFGYSFGPTMLYPALLKYLAQPPQKIYVSIKAITSAGPQSADEYLANLWTVPKISEGAEWEAEIPEETREQIQDLRKLLGSSYVDCVR